MANTRTPLSDDLQQKIEEIALEQNREPAEVLDEAVRRYIGIRTLEKLAERNEQRARAMGIREEDVPRLVDEVRRENQSRGR